MLAVGTDKGVYTFASRGKTWELRASALEEAAINGLAAVGGDGGLAASARHKGVYGSEDAGKSWRPLLEKVDAWCVAQAPDGALYAGVNPAGLYRSRSAGEEWEDLEAVKTLPSYQSWTFPVSPHIANMHSLAFSPRDHRTVYAGVEVGGVIASPDSGDTWEELREGLHLDIHTLASAPGEEDILYTATGRGFFRSHDAGVTWESAGQGLRSIYLVPMAVHPRDPRILFTAASMGRPRYWRRPEGAAATIYRSVDGGDKWEPVMSGLPSTLKGMVAVLAMDPVEPDRVYAGTSDGQVLVSGALGDSWQVLAQGLPPVHALAGM
jgi:photosystem II stability/assembly factor-like uncharacterized protein